MRPGLQALCRFCMHTCLLDLVFPNYRPEKGVALSFELPGRRQEWVGASSFLLCPLTSGLLLSEDCRHLPICPPTSCLSLLHGSPASRSAITHDHRPPCFLLQPLGLLSFSGISCSGAFKLLFPGPENRSFLGSLPQAFLNSRSSGKLLVQVRWPFSMLYQPNTPAVSPRST